MFERYNEKARRAIFFARYEAAQYGSPYIETEHLLFGILRDSRDVLRQIAPSAPADFERRWREEAEPPYGRPASSTSADLPLSNESKRVLAYAAEEAERVQDRHIGVEHLLLGLLRERQRAFAMLEQIGVTLEKARNHVEASSYTVTPCEGWGLESAQGIPFVQFLDERGAPVGVVPVGSLTHLPREGDVVEFSVGAVARRYKVAGIKYVFEPISQVWPYKDHDLAKVVVRLERVGE